MPVPIESTRALVTGASSGIGAALARKLAARGVEVWLAARRRALLDEQVAAIAAAGGRAHAVVLDVCGADAADEVSRLDDAIGGIDLVVANAGIGVPDDGPHTLKYEDVKRVFDTNLHGSLAAIVPLLSRMAARRRGHVVAISSIIAQIPLSKGAPYAASKAALSFFVDAIRPAMAAHGVAVTLVHPGFVKTPMTDANDFPMPFMVGVDDAADRIDRAIRRRRGFVAFPWPLRALIALGNLAPASLRHAVVVRAARGHSR